MFLSSPFSTLRRWLKRPKRDDPRSLVVFYYADESLNQIVSALDKWNGRGNCESLVDRLRIGQQELLQATEQIINEAPGVKALLVPRDYRCKFPEDVQEELGGYYGPLWFGAECLAAGSVIADKEAESEMLRPLATTLCERIDRMRQALRERATVEVPCLDAEAVEAVIAFDKAWTDFEARYVGCWVTVKSVTDYDQQQAVTVMFSEGLLRGMHRGNVTVDAVDDYDPALMVVIPRLAIVWGLRVQPHALDVSSEGACPYLFRPYLSDLLALKGELSALTDLEVEQLEAFLCRTLFEADVPRGRRGSIGVADEDEAPAIFGRLPSLAVVQLDDDTIILPEDTPEYTADLRGPANPSPLSPSMGSPQSKSSAAEHLQSSATIDVPGETVETSTSHVIATQGAPDNATTQHQEISVVGVEVESVAHENENENDNENESVSGNGNGNEDTIPETLSLPGDDSQQVPSSSQEDELAAERTETESVEDVEIANQTVTDDYEADGASNDSLHDGDSASEHIVPTTTPSEIPTDVSLETDEHEGGGMESEEPTTQTQNVGPAEEETEPETESPRPSEQEEEVELETDPFQEILHRLFVRVASIADKLQSGPHAKDVRYILKTTFRINETPAPEPDPPTNQQVTNTADDKSDQSNAPDEAAAANEQLRSGNPTSRQSIPDVHAATDGAQVAQQLDEAMSAPLLDSPLSQRLANPDSAPAISPHMREAQREQERAELDGELERYRDRERGDPPPGSLPLPQWQRDDEVRQCARCKLPFTFLRRRHHCRCCGVIFCGQCAGHFTPIQHLGYTKPVRVCLTCYVFHADKFLES